jgi:hypothetical protein
MQKQVLQFERVVFWCSFILFLGVCTMWHQHFRGTYWLQLQILSYKKTKCSGYKFSQIPRPSFCPISWSERPPAELTYNNFACWSFWHWRRKQKFPPTCKQHSPVAA